MTIKWLVKEINPHTEDLKRPWQNRIRTDREVTGAIELAYLRGVQAGQEIEKRKKRKHELAKPSP